MTDSKPPTQSANSELEITLGVLNAVQENQSLTQRSVARDLNIALGLANAYLKRCVKKGYVKVRQIPKNRYAYYLTPQGFAEKSRLTAEYLSQSFNFFRLARDQCDDLFRTCAERGWTRVFLVGVSDLGEIATLCAREHPVTLHGVIDTSATEAELAGLPVVGDLDTLADADAAVITDFRNPQAAFDAVCRVLPRDRVMAPPLLNVSRRPPHLEE